MIYEPESSEESNDLHLSSSVAPQNSFISGPFDPSFSRHSLMGYQFQSQSSNINQIKQINSIQPPAKRQKRKIKKTPKFIKILYQILSKRQYNDMIFWTPDQQAFIVNKQKVMQFGVQVLSKYFKHSNYQSFVRQLNMYNFVKIRLRIISQGQQYDSQNDIFKHQEFKRGNIDGLCNIQRKPVNKNPKKTDKDKNNQIQIQIINEQANQNQNQNEEQEESSNQQNRIALINNQFKNLNKNTRSLFKNNINNNIISYQNQNQNFILQQKQKSNIFPIQMDYSYQVLLSTNRKITQSIDQRIQSLKYDQDNLQNKCMQLFNQNQMINSQISNLYRRIHIQTLNKNKIIEQLIKYLNLLQSKNKDSNNHQDNQEISSSLYENYEIIPSSSLASSKAKDQQYLKSRKSFQFSLQKFINLLKNNQANQICLQMFQQFFDKREIQIFMQKFSFLLESQLRYTNPSINKQKVIPLSYEQPQKRSPKMTFQDFFEGNQLVLQNFQNSQNLEEDFLNKNNKLMDKFQE